MQTCWIIVNITIYTKKYSTIREYNQVPLTVSNATCYVGQTADKPD